VGSKSITALLRGMRKRILAAPDLLVELEVVAHAGDSR